MSKPHPHELRVELELNASVAQIWRCWVEPELLKQWFCPKPWQVVDVRMDMRPGGEFYTLMQGPNGEQFGEPGVFLHVEPRHRIMFTDAFQPGWLPSARAFIVGDFTYFDLGNGRTRFLGRAYHWNAEAEAEHAAMGFEPGWTAAAKQLEALAASLKA